ncbi:MAG: hypothetical protein JSV58_06040, partial [Candidatus Bathyarchaeota archaeon]
LETLGVTMYFGDFTIFHGTGAAYSPEAMQQVPEYSALKMNVTIEYGGGTYHDALWIRLYTIHGVVSTPLIISTWTGDIYIHMHHTASMYNALVQALLDTTNPPEDLLVTVEIIPLTNLVWLGAALMSFGVATPIIGSIISHLRVKSQHLGEGRT